MSGQGRTSQSVSKVLATPSANGAVGPAQLRPGPIANGGNGPDSMLALRRQQTVVPVRGDPLAGTEPYPLLPHRQQTVLSGRPDGRVRLESLTYRSVVAKPRRIRPSRR